MADSKKYDGSQWEHSLRKLTTATEAVENPLYSDGIAITAYTLKGNEEHTGTPSPSNPVMPNGVGEMSDNLCNPTPYKAGYYINAEGQEVQNNVFDVYSISATANQSYTISANVTLGGNTVRIHAYTNGTWTEQVKAESSGDLPWSFTAPTGCDEIRISITHNAYEHIMVNTGTTALPFEPYGQYKIPISSGQQTTNIYLTEQLMKIGDTADSLVPTGTVNRVLYRYEFTGNETWIEDTRMVYLSKNYLGDIPAPLANSALICSHFPNNNVNGMVNGGAWVFQTYGYTAVASDLSTWKQWLADQYAAGTPVTVYYVLETPTTETVTAPSIPTTEGANSIAVDTTVQPSEFTATWTGWHNSSVKEWDGSIWQ